MPRLSVYMIRTALIHLGIGFTLGALILWNKGLPFAPFLWRLLPVHIHFVIFGWMIQLAMGTAFWILPRFSTGHRYGNERLGWMAFGLVNLSMLIIVLQPFIGFTLEIVSYSALLLSVLCFVLLIWFRIKPFAEGAKS